MFEELTQKVSTCLPSDEVLLVVPPFAGIDLPSIAAHLLQACAARDGIKISVFYANLALAGMIGESRYQELCDGPGLLGERFFSHAAYGKSIEALFPSEAKPQRVQWLDPDLIPLGIPELRELAKWASEFVRVLAEGIAAKSYRVVGCTSTFEQTSSTIAILNTLKDISPHIITVIGGGNCEGEMAQGISALAKRVDYVFSGESEKAFPEFLYRLLQGEAPDSKIVRQTSSTNVQDLPLPDFTEYHEQVKAFLPDSETLRPEEVWLPYESSRGCWWGEKYKCTFCGLNGENITHRKKDADLVFDQLSAITQKYRSKNIFVIDNIMPHEYFKTLLPRLEGIVGLNLFYEQKSNLSLDNLKRLKRAGINLIQPGIESLSSPLLKLMNKGVTSRQHINLLRNARKVGVSLNWNLLYDFPGDRAEYYEEMLSYLPHLIHLHPPLKLLHLSLDRFSPYFEAPAHFGISNLQAVSAYAEILPEDAEVANIAYHFSGEYESGIRSQPALIEALQEAVSHWRNSWMQGGAAPALSIIPMNEDDYLLLDSRYNNKKARYDFLTKQEVWQLLTEKPVREVNRDDYEWIMRRHLMMEVDGYYVPLALNREPDDDTLPSNPTSIMDKGDTRQTDPFPILQQ